jgi:hypothetical protein
MMSRFRGLPLEPRLVLMYLWFEEQCDCCSSKGNLGH